MIRFFQKTTIILSIIAAVVLHSCVGSNDIEERTESTEKAEMSQAIANLTAKGYNVDTTAFGVYYIMGKTGTGNLPQKGDTCEIIYTGFFLNGSVFDASYFYRQDSIWSMVYKTTSVIPGFEDAIGKLNKGAKADFFILSNLGYGSNGYFTIPPYTTIAFNIKMKNIKPAN